MIPFNRFSGSDMDMVKLCGVGFLCALVAVIMKQIKTEYAPLVRAGGVVLVFGAVALWTADIFSEVSSFAFTEGITGYGKIMMKALCLALISKICGDICRDMGESAVGGGIELGGKLAILSLCIPLIEELMGYARELMGL